MGHARAFGAPARPGTRATPPRRADKPSRFGIARLVPGIFEKLFGRDPDDFARSRIFESARRFDCGDRAPAFESLSRELGQLRGAESGARRTAARGLQKPAKG